MLSTFKKYIGLTIGISLGLSIFPRSAFSSDLGGQWSFADPNQSAEIQIRKSNAKLQIRVVRQGELDLPDYIEVSLVGADGKYLPMQLNAIYPEILSRESKFYREYSGPVPSSLESYIGISVRLPLGWSPTQPLFQMEK